MPGTAHELKTTLAAVLLKYEPRIQDIHVVMLEQTQPGELRYAIEAQLHDGGLLRFGTEFMPEGKVLLRHLKQQRILPS
ncbi:Lysozyme [compost metagenome]